MEAKTLASILNEMPLPEANGRAGALVNLDGVRSELKTRLRSLSIIGQSERGGAPAEQTGLRAGVPGAGKIAPEVPAMLAEECTTKRLPQCVQSWLTDMETWRERAEVMRLTQPPKPALTPAEVMTIRFELAVLDQILLPSSSRGDELVFEVSSFFAVMPFQKGDESEKKLKINAWCTELERHPLYAVKRALGWWRRNGKKEPSFAEVLEDVRLFTGHNVLSRQRLLAPLVSGQA
jgi:hypothetical protein